jgi:hypothetical protein
MEGGSFGSQGSGNSPLQKADSNSDYEGLTINLKKMNDEGSN